MTDISRAETIRSPIVAVASMVTTVPLGRVVVYVCCAVARMVSSGSVWIIGLKTKSAQGMVHAWTLVIAGNSLLEYVANYIFRLA